MPELYSLYEFASGYALLHVAEWEQIGQDSEAVQEAVQDFSRLSSMCKLKAFHPFADAEEALNNMNAVANGTVTDELKNFLELNLPKKKTKYTLGVCDPSIGKSLVDAGFSVSYDKNVIELLRGTRCHFTRFSKGLSEFDLDRARCGLAHNYSRTKMQLDPNRQDKPIIQSIALIDSLDKNINLFAMRVREWYCWHFPELGKIITDNIKFAETARLIGVRDSFDPNDEEKFQALVSICEGSEDLAKEVCQAIKTSMGQDIVEADMVNIDKFAEQVVKLAQQRKNLGGYLGTKLDVVAPNLKSVVGDTVAARLISQAGSLVNLCKYPASTVQILGAEKALFRALKTKGNTPKYGLLFQSSFIGRAAQKNKGRISRYLANKCSIASRIDNFSNVQSNVFGERLREQVEERLKFLTEGVAPRKNLDVMREAVAEYGAVVAETETANKKKKKKSKKAKKAEESEDAAPAAEAAVAAEEGVVESSEDKKAKKKKKRAAEEEPVEAAVEVEEAPKKKKKKVVQPADDE